MRLSSSSTLKVGATQLAMLGMPWGDPLAPGFAACPKFCKKSKPGTNFPNPKAEVSLMRAPCGVCQAQA